MNSHSNSTADNGSLFSAGYKLARQFLGIPSRVVGRLRKYDQVINMAQNPPTRTLESTRTPQPTGPYSAQYHSAGSISSVPGPWGFLTSRYFIGLFIMAFILNRVQNIVVPPRNPLASHHRMRHFPPVRRTSITSYILASIFPLDLTSSFSRLVFRVPSIYLLGKTLLLWTVVLLQTAHMYPNRDWIWLQTIGEWANQKSMDDICWFTFTSVCTTLFVGALTSGMEGLDGSHNTPFNLFAYSFVLYLYTSPVVQVEPSQGGGPLRPDRHAIITMILPLFQIRQKWATLRLIPTTVVGILSLAHFHTVFWLYPASYPLPNYVPNLVGSALLAITLFTLSLNAFTQLCLTGSVSKPLLGHTASLMPRLDEDFTMVLFRLGTASLEATSVAGLGNEVGGVGITSASHHPLPDDDRHGVVELSRSGVVSVTPGLSDNQYELKQGFFNEITQVKANPTRTHLLVDTVMNASWRREFGRFMRALWHVIKGTWLSLTSRRNTVPSSPGTVDEDDDTEESDKEVYDKFLRGEIMSDGEDEAYEPDLGQISDDEEQDPDESSSGDGPEIASLYADLSDAASTSSAAPVLLAHMTNASSSPLTRRRYTSLVNIPTQAGPQPYDTNNEDDWDTFVRARRENTQRRLSSNGNDDGAIMRSCVVCTVEPREIICWPCRCLALCDDCRENMASRSAASKHSCPCCRRNVEGYSRIYIP
ncbi:unnamed protein product [Somion occarium]|uniref:RING-type domain-containing protein n=1 Tax=Somion occarium TaxID=3059160 RepID=A0ABP1DD51_9APHY